MSEQFPVANAIANRCSASSSFRIALWKNENIRIGDSDSDRPNPPPPLAEESTLLTGFASTATPPPPPTPFSPVSGVAMRFQFFSPPSGNFLAAQFSGNFFSLSRSALQGASIG